MTAPAIQFEIIPPGNAERRVETFHQGVIKIWRLQSSHLRIEDMLCARMHAVIEVVDPDTVYLIDLGSTTGTLLLVDRYKEKIYKAQIYPKDEIYIGETLVRIVSIEGATGSRNRSER